MAKVKIVPTSILDPMFREAPTAYTPRMSSPESDDEDQEESLDSEEEKPCPFCNQLSCEDHLLACIDESGDSDNRVGIVGGTLYDVKEIDTIFEKICMSWVKWVRIKPKAPKPSWITNNSVILDYFKSFGETSDFKNDDTSLDDDRVYELLGEVDPYQNRCFLEDMCSQCGWTGISNREYGPDVPLLSTSYTNLYDPKPKDVADKLRTAIQALIKQADASLGGSESK